MNKAVIVQLRASCCHLLNYYVAAQDVLNINAPAANLPKSPTAAKSVHFANTDAKLSNDDKFNYSSSAVLGFAVDDLPMHANDAETSSENVTLVDDSLNLTSRNVSLVDGGLHLASSKQPEDALNATSPNTTQNSNLDGYIDDSYFGAEPTSLPSLDEGNRLSISAMVEELSQKPQYQFDELGQKMPYQFDKSFQPILRPSRESLSATLIQKDYLLKEKLTSAYPHLMNVLEDCGAVNQEALAKDVQEMVLSLQASTGLLKIKQKQLKSMALEGKKCKPIHEEEMRPVIFDMQSRETQCNSDEFEQPNASKLDLNQSRKDSEYTLLKSLRNSTDDSDNHDSVKIMKELEETKSDVHRLQGMCAGLQQEKNNLCDQLEAWQKYSDMCDQLQVRFFPWKF